MYVDCTQIFKTTRKRDAPLPRKPGSIRVLQQPFLLRHSRLVPFRLNETVILELVAALEEVQLYQMHGGCRSIRAVNKRLAESDDVLSFLVVLAPIRVCDACASPMEHVLQMSVGARCLLTNVPLSAEAAGEQREFVESDALFLECTSKLAVVDGLHELLDLGSKRCFRRNMLLLPLAEGGLL
ncbi:hypothetical protein C8F01DRAFT_1170095, partial [Mycena amicta]